MNPPTENPLRRGLSRTRAADPCTIVIFGGTGDLTRRKLLPALYRLRSHGDLPAASAIVAVARREKTDEQFRTDAEAALKEFMGETELDPRVWSGMRERLFYHASTFGDADGYVRLRELLDRLDREHDTRGNRIYYLASPPQSFEPITQNLGAAGLVGESARQAPWTRLVVEKPFGHDLDSARELNAVVAATFAEEQTYRIDHYLGKETVQNILVLRFGNGLFEPVWNRKYIDHVQITVSEDLGVGTRGGYFEGAGILRDMIQNHLMQLLCLVAMEPPVAFDPDAVRDEKVKVLRALRPLASSDSPPEQEPACVVRGQYGPGWIKGEPVAGYREEQDIAPESPTETYVALKVFIDSWRWAGIPFYLRSGKRLPKRVTEIAIVFKEIPHLLFAEEQVEPNVLALRIQPDESIALRIGCKVPGPEVVVQPVRMEFLYGTAFGFDPPEAYERLLHDVIIGDSTLFTRRDEVEASWRWITPLLQAWQQVPSPEFPNYDAGSWGPDEADRLIEPNGAWRRP